MLKFMVRYSGIVETLKTPLGREFSVETYLVGERAQVPSEGRNRLCKCSKISPALTKSSHAMLSLWPYSSDPEFRDFDGQSAPWTESRPPQPDLWGPIPPHKPRENTRKAQRQLRALC